MLFALLGSYAANADPLDLVILLVLELLGFVMRRYGWPVAPVVIGLILGRSRRPTCARQLALVVVNSTRGDALVDSRYLAAPDAEVLRARLDALELTAELRQVNA